MNKDNDVAGPFKACNQTINNSQECAVKVMDLAGSLFIYKDKKKCY